LSSTAPRPRTVSVIIPVARGHEPDKAVRALREIDYPAARIEVLVVRGNQPSKQRNLAAREARGEILYFLDNDSEIDPETLSRVVEILRDPGIAAVGGPVIGLEDASPLQRAFHGVFSSRLGVGAVRHRYRPVGTQARPANEKMLMSCNLSVRQTAFEQVGGFNEDLYPHEDNELVNRLVEAKLPVVYHPRVLVRRGQRPSLSSYLQQIVRDGMGRGRHYAIHPRFFDPVCLVPVAFLAYLATIPLVSHPAYLAPLAIYGVAAVASSVAGAVRTKSLLAGLLLHGLYPATHITYGAAFLWGLARSSIVRKESQESFWFDIEYAGERLPLDER